MIVCICKNVNVHAIQTTIASGIDTLEGIREATGAGACCGKCQFKVNRVLTQHVGQSNDSENQQNSLNYA